MPRCLVVASAEASVKLNPMKKRRKADGHLDLPDSSGGINKLRPKNQQAQMTVPMSPAK